MADKKHKPFEIYAVHGDGGERGTGPIIGYCKTAVEADCNAKGQGWYGGDGRVSKVWAIDIDGTIYVLAQASPIMYMDQIKKQKQLDDQLREATLNALTAEQRRVLGF